MTPILTSLLPETATQHVLDLADWQWQDPALEQWTRGQFPHALERRCVEFAAGRLCAARAVSTLTGATVRPERIGRTRDGGPSWPEGLAGSIAHTRDIAAAVAIRHDAAIGIGLDIESIMSAARADKLARRIASTLELSRLRDGAAVTHAEAVTLAFSVKEALFKCLHPLVGRRFYFGDAHVEQAAFPPRPSTPDQRWAGLVTIRLTTDLSADVQSGRTFRGSVACEGGRLYAVVWVSSAELIEERQQRRA